MQWKNIFYVAAAFCASILDAGAAPAHGASPLYVVSYYEVIAPSQGGARRPAPNDIFLEHQRALSRQRGAVSVDLLRDRARPEHYTIIERWATPDDYAAYLASAAARQFADDVGPWLASPQDVRAYTTFQ